MSMHIETSSPRAFALTSESLADINHYKRSKDWSRLEEAQAKLRQARDEDPNYLHAVYYSALVNDLMGRAEDALPQLEAVVQENPPFIEEARYNLGLAHYHRYSRSHLEKAAEHFNAVIENTDDPVLKILARAGLAQTYAMRMIQPDPTRPDYADAQKHFDLSVEQYKIVSAALDELKDEDAEALNDIKWEVCNSHGMAHMYYSDYFGDREDKIRMLSNALRDLQKADEHSPKNWANYCDMGSVHMRLGHWRREDSESHFDAALRFLGEVVGELRPNYGFALYETGRTHRLMGKFGKAVEYFDAALEIPYEYRDVSDGRVNFEKERALAESVEFP